MQIVTRYGTVNDVPMITWKEFEPYWESVVRAMIEVIHENRFRLYSASYNNIDGIVATYKYWNTFEIEEEFEFQEALRFIKLLKEKEEFTNAIKLFNRNNKTYNINWLASESLPLLGNRIYGFYHILKPFFSRIIDENDEEWLAVNFNRITE